MNVLRLKFASLFSRMERC